MKKKLLAIALTAMVVMFPVTAVHALMIAPPPGPVRIVNSDAVFVGRVIQIEPVDIEAKSFPGAKTTTKYRIAVVKVNEIIRGLKNEKTIRVGFVPFVQPKPMPGRPILIGGRRSPQLEIGQEGLFMISKHLDGKFYNAPNFGYFVPLAQKSFAEEVKTAKKVVQIMANTTATLKSKDADERMMAASIVISKYRMQKAPFPNKEEPIGAEESKLILNALATAKWQPAKFGDPNPWMLFNQLGITAKDGWKAPMQVRNQDDLRDAVRGWIRAHGDTYRVKRFVAQSDR